MRLLNMYDICYNLEMGTNVMDLAKELKRTIRSQNISQLARETGIARSVIYDFLEDKNITSRHLFKLMEHSLFAITEKENVRHMINIEKLNIKPQQHLKLRRLIDLIVEHCHPTKIILFGSQARGDARPDSDFDLCLVDCRKKLPAGELKILARRAQIGLYFDYLVFSASRLKSGSKSINSVEHNITKDGIPIYDSGSSSV